MLKFWKTVLTCAKLKLNLIALSHFKSANVYVAFEVCAILKLVFMIFSVRTNKARPILTLGGN